MPNPGALDKVKKKKKTGKVRKDVRLFHGNRVDGQCRE
jgi:hypothetical protein